MSNAYISINITISQNRPWDEPRAKRSIEFNIPTDAAGDVDYTTIIRRLVAQASLEYDTTPTPKVEEEDE